MKFPLALWIAVGGGMLAPASALACSNLWSTVGEFETLSGERPGCAKFWADEGKGRNEEPMLGLMVVTECPSALEVEVLDCPECEAAKTFPAADLEAPRSERTRFDSYDLGIDVETQLGETFEYAIKWTYEGEEGMLQISISVTDVHPDDQELCGPCSIGGKGNGVWGVGILAFLGWSRRKRQ